MRVQWLSCKKDPPRGAFCGHKSKPHFMFAGTLKRTILARKNELTPSFYLELRWSFFGRGWYYHYSVCATRFVTQENLIKADIVLFAFTRARAVLWLLHKRELVLRASAQSLFRPTSTAVVALLRLPAIFLGRKNSLRL